MSSPLRITVWGEFRHEKKNPKVAELYPQGMHETIAGFLRTNADFTVRTDRIDVGKCYAQDIPPEVAGYDWKQKRKNDADKPPTGSGSRV